VKRCPACGETKPLEAFAIDRWRADGRKSSCRACDSARSAAYYAAHRERVIERVSTRAKRIRREATPPGHNSADPSARASYGHADKSLGAGRSERSSTEVRGF
jgi:hypothetical protein